MIKRNQWYKLTEDEFTNILRFVDKDIANNQKYIESLNRVGDAYNKHKILYVQLQYHHFPSQGLYNKFYAWHYRSSYSEYYCGQYLEYTDIVFDKCCDAIDAARYALKDTVYGPRPLTSFGLVDQDLNKKVPLNFSLGADYENDTGKDKEKNMESENKMRAITSIIDTYHDDCLNEYNKQFEKEINEVKEDDVITCLAKQVQDLINSRAAQTGAPTGDISKYIIYSNETVKKLNKLTDVHNKQISQLNAICREVRDLCMLCDTYEQMRQVLADYDIIPNSKKRGK